MSSETMEVCEDSLVQDTDTGKKEKKNYCINNLCKSSVNLVVADSSMFAFFKVKMTNKTEFVCISCEKKVEKHVLDMMETLRTDQSLMQVEFPERNDIVCIDSDEEITDIDSDSGDEDTRFDSETMDLINSQINDIIEESIPPTSQINAKALEYIIDLTKNAELICKDLQETQATLSANQIKLDEISKEFYDQFSYKIKNLAPLDIVSSEESTEPTAVQPVACGAPLGNHQEEYRHQQVQQHNSLLQRRLLNSNNTSLTPIVGSTNDASPTTRSAADDMIVEERRTISSRPLNLPRLAPVGLAIQKPPIYKDTVLWAMKKSSESAWSKCIVEEVITTLDENKRTIKRYKVKFLLEKKFKVLAGNCLAYTTPNEYLYRVGMRVISIFATNEYYSGTVGEIPKETNKWRYLIFFDDGYTSYVNHEDILMICEPSDKTQDDVPLILREFVRDYLQKYPERTMVRMNPGEKISTQFKSKWVMAKVLEVDCSLARMQFGSLMESDWVFRGSTRLRPLYESKINAARRENTRRAKPTSSGSSEASAGANNYVVSLSRPKVQTARKSLSGRSPRVYYETTADRKVAWTPVKVPGQLVYKRVEGVEIVQSKKFVPHTCNKTCVNWIRWSYESLIKKINLLAIPLYTGFRRNIRTFQKDKKCVMYKAPCGRTLRSSEQLVLYLFNTRSKWTIDMFEFDHFVDCLREFSIENANITIKDMSNGRENVPISCVNYIDTDVPKTVDYMTERKPKEGVIINTNTEFLVCCDCTDDCRNKDECACWQLTINESRRLSNNAEPKDFVGYQNRRLPERVVSGIFECNERCKCKSTCHNRVVQFPMLQKLQLFKTEMKGWGLRCLHDIPLGTFLCIYVGHLLTDNDADEEGTNYGDEYLADLDFIETAERFKENYESDVPEEDMMDENDSVNNSDEDASRNSNEDNSAEKDIAAILDSDDDAGSNSNASDSTDTIRTRLRKRTQKEKDKKDGRDGKRKMSSLLMTLQARQPKKPKPRKSLREYFGEDESVYIMDARTSGNIGRYLNHSCSPNVVVQNVFVDTHDPRFPWVCFFASKYIEAGTELTWDYAYDIGSVSDKVMYCYCGASECRGRLL